MGVLHMNAIGFTNRASTVTLKTFRGNEGTPVSGGLGDGAAPPLVVFRLSVAYDG